MIHEMKLKDKPFNQIKNNTKTIELRLYDEKRKKISIKDYIIFTNINTSEKIKVQVTNIYIFNNFKELYTKIDNRLFGYNNNNANYKDMEEYYSKEEQEKYGVIGIEIKKCKLT